MLISRSTIADVGANDFHQLEKPEVVSGRYRQAVLEKRSELALRYEIGEE
jgi:hypothetical protein